MPRILLRDTQPGFGKGLNTTADESQLEPDEVRQAENARLTEYGGVTKRLGSQRVSTSSLGGSATGGFVWRKTTPASHYVTAGSSLWRAVHGVYPWTWTSISGLDSSAIPSFASFRDIGSDALYIADGGQLNKIVAPNLDTLQANLTDTPNVSRLAVHNQRLFAVGDPANTETVYFSGLSNGDTLGSVAAGGGSAIVRTFANEPLTGLLSVGQSLLMFHERGVSRFTGWGQQDFSIDSGTRGVTQDVGTISPNSIVGVENVGFFVTDRGAYQITESGVQGISSKIESILSAVDSTTLRSVSAAHNRSYREVWFSIPGLGILVYNYRLQSWSGPLTGTYLSQSPGAIWESGASSVSQVFFGGADGYVRQADVSQVYKDDVLSDGTGGSAIEMTVQCHRFFYGDNATEKSLRYIYVNGNLRGSALAFANWETGQTTGSAALSLSGTVSLWGSGVWGTAQWGAGGSSTSRVQAHGSGKYNDIRITDSGASNPVFSRLEADSFDMSRRY